MFALPKGLPAALWEILIPPDHAVTPEKLLGRRLYYDQRLSPDGPGLTPADLEPRRAAPARRIIGSVKAKGCLIAIAVGLGFMALLLALVGPAMVREGGRIYRPIAQMQGAQKDFETWSREHDFKAPLDVSLSAEQLHRFLGLRRHLDAINEKNPLPIEGMRRNQRPSLSQIQGLLEGMGGSVSGQMDAFREAGMPPEEYRYLERIVYRRWLRPLRAKGLDPAAVSRAAKELTTLAAAEKDAAVAGRLKRLAQSLSEQRVPAPEGIPPEVHAILLARAIEIDALIDVGPAIPLRGGRTRLDF